MKDQKRCCESHGHTHWKLNQIYRKRLFFPPHFYGKVSGDCEETGRPSLSLTELYTPQSGSNRNISAILSLLCGVFCVCARASLRVCRCRENGPLSNLYWSVVWNGARSVSQAACDSVCLCWGPSVWVHPQWTKTRVLHTQKKGRL